MQRFPEGISSAAWSGIAEDHLWAAQHLQELADAEERSGTVGAHLEGYRRHRAYVVSSLLSSVAYLECAINEIFSSCAEMGVPELLSASSPDHRKVLADLWSEETRRLPILRKYELALITGRCRRHKKGETPYADVALLIRLRNALVHYEPEWVFTERSDGRQIEQEHMQKFGLLLRSKAAPNPLAGEKYPYWPDRCLSAECAEWAVRSVKEFFALFQKLMDPTVR